MLEHGGRTTRTVGRVLIHIALLSTTSGWQLPSNDEEAGHLIFRALVLIGAATTFCAAFTPHMTRPSAASKRVETDQPDVCPPHWLLGCVSGGVESYGTPKNTPPRAGSAASNAPPRDQFSN